MCQTKYEHEYGRKSHADRIMLTSVMSNYLPRKFHPRRNFAQKASLWLFHGKTLAFVFLKHAESDGFSSERIIFPAPTPPFNQNGVQTPPFRQVRFSRAVEFGFQCQHSHLMSCFPAFRSNPWPASAPNSRTPTLSQVRALKPIRDGRHAPGRVRACASVTAAYNAAEVQPSRSDEQA